VPGVRSSKSVIRLIVTLIAVHGLILSPCVDYLYGAVTLSPSPWPAIGWIVSCLLVLNYLHLLPYLRSRKRRKLGLCTNCGYNLEGLTENRCPECATEF